MSLSRRKTLAILGGGVILAAGVAGYTVTRQPTRARAPWSAAGGYDEPRMRALSYAILAPNPHNMQPWLVDLDTPGEITLHVDRDRLLPHTDPFSRQIVIGLGCFLEILRLAAAEDGFRVETELFPEGSDDQALDVRPVAVCVFVKDAEPEPELFAQVPHRRSLKEPYDTERPVTDDVLAALAYAAVAGTVVGHTNATDEVETLRELTVQAFEVEFETDATYRESVDLFRIGAREVNANPDGLEFTGPAFEALRLTGLFTREGALDRDGMSYKQALEMISATARTGMAYLWLTTDGNSREEQIAAGRDWVRVNLAATGLGLGIQPMSQALQEYPEMAGHYEVAHGLLAPEGGTVQMLGRLGYGPDIPVTPRWPLEAKIMHG